MTERFGRVRWTDAAGRTGCGCAMSYAEAVAIAVASPLCDRASGVDVKFKYEVEVLAECARYSDLVRGGRS